MQAYVHVWQAFLMFLGGAFCIVASLVGYLRSGGGEELLQQALVRFLPTGGAARFDSLDFNLVESTLTVRGLEHSDIPKNHGQAPDRVSGLRVERCEIKLDAWPWPPRVDSIHLHGMRKLELAVSRNFLQRGNRPYPIGPPFPVHFDGVDLAATIGTGPRLRLTGCSGVLQRGPAGGLIGEIHLTALNGQPFRCTLSARADGRWEFHGAGLEIDTQALQSALPKNAVATIDPVELLVRALWTGEMGAKGTVEDLRVAVRPLTGERPFACEGKVAYRNLALRLPPQKAPAAQAVPRFLDWMLGGRQSLWPSWLLPDAIQTGPGGRVSFHMYGKRLEFACDEGPGSALVAKVNGRNLPPLESFKGSIVTDEAHRPKRIILRGFLGEDFSCELRMKGRPGGSRVFQLLLEPRAAGTDKVAFRAPLWRFRSRIEDFSDVAAAAKRPDGTLVGFHIEIASDSLPHALLLPPGVRDLSGRVFIEGRYTRQRVLTLDVRWEKGGLVFGGAEPSGPHPLLEKAYGPLLEGLKGLWGGGKEAWRLQDVVLHGQAVVRFGRENQWLSTELKNWKLSSGRVVYRGRATDLGASGIEVAGRYLRKPKGRAAAFAAGVKEKNSEHWDWSMRLAGRLQDDGDGELRFEERHVPLELHPDRDHIPSAFIHGFLFNKRVSRKTILRIQDGKPERTVQE